MIAVLDDAEAAMNRFRTKPTMNHAGSARAAITELAAGVTDHLAHEEREMEPIAAANRAAPEFVEVQKVVRRAHRENTGSLFGWLQDGADEDCVSGIRREVPRPVLFVITRTRRSEVPSRRLVRVGGRADGGRPCAFAVGAMSRRNLILSARRSPLVVRQTMRVRPSRSS